MGSEMLEKYGKYIKLYNMDNNLGAWNITHMEDITYQYGRKLYRK